MNWKKAVNGAGQALCLLGCLWFIMPALHGGFGLGAVFGVCVCLLGFSLLHFYRRLAEKGGWRKAMVRLVSAFFLLGFLWAGYLTAVMLSAQALAPPESANVMVLGARIYSAEHLGVSLQNRVEKAYEYLEVHPDAQCIVTGGQGDDEPCPEAVAERNALVRMGIDPQRIFLEDRSRNTRENMKFSMELAESCGLGREFAVVTQSFHMGRALGLAKEAGFEAYSLVADTDWILFPEYYGRELLSLTKYHLEMLLPK